MKRYNIVLVAIIFCSSIVLPVVSYAEMTTQVDSSKKVNKSEDAVSEDVVEEDVKSQQTVDSEHKDLEEGIVEESDGEPITKTEEKIYYSREENFLIAERMGMLRSSAPSEFINSVAVHASNVAQRNGLFTSIMIAQAALESGYGTSQLSQAPNYNLFGVKGSYNGNSVLMWTKEWDGTKFIDVQANFKRYPSFEQSFADNARVIVDGPVQNPDYYAKVKNAKTYQEAAQALTGTYATDPNYGDKLINIIENYGLAQYDTLKIVIGDESFTNIANANNALNQITSKYSVWAQVTKGGDKVPFYTLTTGGFVGWNNVMRNLNKFRDETGWWAQTVPTNQSIDYLRVVSGGFYGKELATSALEDFQKNTGWWAQLHHLGNNIYRIETGEVSGTNNLAPGLDFFKSKNWWYAVETTGNKEPIYAIQTGEFSGSANLLKGSSYMENNNWWFQSNVSKYVDSYQVETGGFYGYDLPNRIASEIQSLYGYKTKIELNK